LRCPWCTSRPVWVDPDGTSRRGRHRRVRPVANCVRVRALAGSIPALSAMTPLDASYEDRYYAGDPREAAGYFRRVEADRRRRAAYDALSTCGTCGKEWSERDLARKQRLRDLRERFKEDHWPR
jgi:hypothetical protein